MRILSIFGTRPEAIKMAPVITALDKHPDIDSKVCATAQHREMLDQVLNTFSIIPDFDLNIMTKQQDLIQITNQVLLETKNIIEKTKPDWILVHGDTTTAFSASLAAFYAKIPVGHVEAGLRSHDNYAPFPEEMNRKFSDLIANLHFAPTKSAANNLLKENIPKSKIIITGNTVIDSLLFIVDRLRKDVKLQKEMEKQFSFLDKSKQLILVTGHRRENFGIGFENICNGLLSLSNRSDVEIIYPVHFNPNVRNPVERLLTNNCNIYLIDPLDYVPFVYLMEQCYFIITDSGGIQEEAPALGKPVLVMRNVTERPEAIEEGTVRLIGTDKQKLVYEANLLLDNSKHYKTMSKAHNPYGDGQASERIVHGLLKNSNDT